MMSPQTLAFVTIEMIDKDALKESLVDVSLGIFFAVPISFITLLIAQKQDLDVSHTAILQVTVFPFFAILRKYFVRVNHK